MTRGRTPRRSERYERSSRRARSPSQRRHERRRYRSPPQPTQPQAAELYPRFDHTKPGSWATHLSRFQCALVANRVRHRDEKKALLACTLDEVTFAKLADWLPQGVTLDTATYSQVVDALSDNIKPASRLGTYAAFTCRQQRRGETAEAYMAELQRMVEGIDAGSFAPTLVTLQFAVGLKNLAARQAILARTNVSAVEALSLAVAAERASELTTVPVELKPGTQTPVKRASEPVRSMIKEEPQTPIPPPVHVPEEALIKMVNDVLGEKPKVSRGTPKPSLFRKLFSRSSRQGGTPLKRRTPIKIRFHRRVNIIKPGPLRESPAVAV